MNKFHLWLRFLAWIDTLVIRKNQFLLRRPHRSFRLSRRRDYKRSLALPGYWSFSGQVARYLWKHWRLFGALILLYTITTVVIGGVTNQSVYEQINVLINQSAGEVFQGVFGSIGQAGLLLVSAFVSPGQLTSEQQIYLSIAAILVWLTTVWLLRSLMAGGRPKLRDGLYSAGSPLVSMAIITVIAVIQLIPIALTALVYAGLSAAGILQEGAGMMIFWVFAALVITLVLYWMTSTFLAMVIITLPGMYPMRALKAAGDLVVGRRLRILYRLLWGTFVTVIAGACIMIPVVLLDAGVKNLLPAIKGLPFVPFLAAFMGATTVVWISAYIYMLYRRVVDDGANPA